MVQDHVIHFYHLHALDWVDIVSALSADPAKTAPLAQSISDWPLSSTTYFAGVRENGSRASSSAASSAPSPTPTGGTPPTSCRPRPT